MSAQEEKIQREKKKMGPAGQEKNSGKRKERVRSGRVRKVRDQPGKYLKKRRQLGGKKARTPSGQPKRKRRCRDRTTGKGGTEKAKGRLNARGENLVLTKNEKRNSEQQDTNGHTKKRHKPKRRSDGS